MTVSIRYVKLEKQTGLISDDISLTVADQSSSTDCTRKLHRLKLAQRPLIESH